jgi:hypothetical protein
MVEKVALKPKVKKIRVKKQKAKKEILNVANAKAKSTVNININASSQIIGGNNWIFHTPDDKRTTMYIAPAGGYGQGDWQWGKATVFNNDGSVNVQGGLTTGAISANGVLTLPNGWKISGDSDFLRVKKNDKDVFAIRNDGHIWSAPYGGYVSEWVGANHIKVNDMINLSNIGTNNHSNTSAQYHQDKGYLSVCGNNGSCGYTVNLKSMKDKNTGNATPEESAQWRINKF